MPHLHQDDAHRALNRLHTPDARADHLQARARNRLHATPPPRVIEIGEVTAGIAVPERGGVRFFSSERDFDPLDGLVFRSVEQAAKAARDRFAARRAPRRHAVPTRLDLVRPEADLHLHRTAYGR
ncbi:hypothetical protein MBUL_01348 [Methylobacterium bullatum]|uniref:Uncharacterized protein n=1 Tax=Methylobacterium bullatum TaxID=570505 RepID=A0A679IR09_9HYPH|nr:hypothetical protein MBUL_01348 [Methylobacterium bullatum]